MIKIIESLVTFVAAITTLLKPTTPRKEVPPCCKCPYLNGKHNTPDMDQTEEQKNKKKRNVAM